jgi:hypothetical protein
MAAIAVLSKGGGLLRLSAAIDRLIRRDRTRTTRLYIALQHLGVSL